MKYKPLLFLLLTVLAMGTLASMITTVNSAVVYDSTLAIEHVMDYGDTNVVSASDLWSTWTMKLFNGNTTALNSTAVSVNGTGGYKWTTGIGNATLYCINLYKDGNFVAASNSSFGGGGYVKMDDSAAYDNVWHSTTIFKLLPLAWNVNSSGISTLINYTGVTYTRVAYETLGRAIPVLKIDIASITAYQHSKIKVMWGTNRGTPVKIMVGGQDITSYQVADETAAQMNRYPNSWARDSSDSRAIWIFGQHHSALSYEVYWSRGAEIWDPTTWFIGMDQTTEILLILLLTAAIAAVVVVIVVYVHSKNPK